MKEEVSLPARAAGVAVQGGGPVCGSGRTGYVLASVSRGHIGPARKQHNTTKSNSQARGDIFTQQDKVVLCRYYVKKSLKDDKKDTKNWELLPRGLNRQATCEEVYKGKQNPMDKTVLGSRERTVSRHREGCTH